MGKKVILHKLQALVGHLNFDCKVVAPGRAFLWCLCDTMKGAYRPHHGIHVTVGMKKDLQDWIHFLEEFNGVGLWREELRFEAELQVHSDAAGYLGLGIFLCGHWCAESWLDVWVEKVGLRILPSLSSSPL